jgi:HAE1 family hydrophobic/amphiphilic exporter-1
MLVGLASKNAILIVEFANHLKAQGEVPLEAVVKAAQIRFRPILMTSLAFMMGILPLVFATGAGAGSRHSLGTAVCGGMLVSTVLSLYFVPIIYLLVGDLRDLLKGQKGRGAKIPSDRLGSNSELSKDSEISTDSEISAEPGRSADSELSAEAGLAGKPD